MNWDFWATSNVGKTVILILNFETTKEELSMNFGYLLLALIRIFYMNFTPNCCRFDFSCVRLGRKISPIVNSSYAMSLQSNSIALWSRNFSVFFVKLLASSILLSTLLLYKAISPPVMSLFGLYGIAFAQQLWVSQLYRLARSLYQ